MDSNLLSVEKANGMSERNIMGGMMRLTLTSVFSASTVPDFEANLNQRILLVMNTAILLTIQPIAMVMPITMVM